MDDAEIALLRLTALKSLNAKKEADLQIQASKALAATKRRSRSPSDSPPTKYSHHSSSSRHPPSANDYLPPVANPISYRASHYGASTTYSPPVLDPYAPKHWPPVGSNLLHHDYHSSGPYVPTKTSISAPGLSQVQLSPRSAAFVLQNNDILARRTGSPPSHPTFGRWSDSPSPPSNHYASNIHRVSPIRRSDGLSRSPEAHQKSSGRQNARRSPSIYRDTGSSRSPPSHNRRYPSRSPPPPSSKRETTRYRSPVTVTNRNRTPLANHLRNSPPARRRSPAGTRSPPKRSTSKSNSSSSHLPKSLDRSHTAFQAKPSGNRRRSRSPPAPRRKASRSRSPVGGSSKSSRSVRSSGSDRRENSKHNNDRLATAKRTLIVAKSSRGARSRSRSPGRNHKPTTTLNNVPKPAVVPPESPKEVISVPLVSSSTQKESERSVPADEASQNEPIKADEEEGLPKVSDDDELPHNNANDAGGDDDDDDNDDEHGDEIDLFASDESESENEGRFKCRSNKPERDPNVPVVSFASLGTTGSRAPGQTAVIDANLDDISSSLGISVPDERNHRNHRDRRDRNGRRRSRKEPLPSGGGGGGVGGGVSRGRHTASDRGHHSSGDRLGGGGGGGRYESSRNHRRSAERQSSESTNRVASSGVEVEPNGGSHRKGSTHSKRSDEVSASGLKSTVSAVRSNNKPATASPPPLPSSGPTLKSSRSSSSTVTVPEESSSSAAEPQQRSQPADEPTTTAVAAASAAKKSAIHSRLGAMTNTWKNSKKPWASSSSSSPEKTTTTIVNQRPSK